MRSSYMSLKRVKVFLYSNIHKENKRRKREERMEQECTLIIKVVKIFRKNDEKIVIN